MDKAVCSLDFIVNEFISIENEVRKMKYPMLANYLMFYKNKDGTYRVRDALSDEEYIVEKHVYRFMRALDGKTDPHSIKTPLPKDSVDEIMNWLFQNDLLRTSRILFKEGGTVLCSFIFTKNKTSHRVIACFLNWLLLIAWPLIFIIGTYVFFCNFAKFDTDTLYRSMWIGSIVGFFVGVILHEIGHLIAGMAYGASVFEIGGSINYYVFPGAYVLMDTDRVKKTLRRVQINAAGVEMNFLLAGVSFLVSTMLFSLAGFFFGMAIINIICGFINLLLVDRLDGGNIIADLLGNDNVFDKAKEIMRNRKKRMALFQRGLTGKVAVIVCGILNIFKISLPLLSLTNIMWFIGICVS